MTPIGTWRGRDSDGLAELLIRSRRFRVAEVGHARPHCGRGHNVLTSAMPDVFSGPAAGKTQLGQVPEDMQAASPGITGRRRPGAHWERDRREQEMAAR